MLYDETRVNIQYHRNMTPTVKHLLSNYQMDIYYDACMNHHRAVGREATKTASIT